MKIIKPQQLSLISRPFRQQGKEWLGIGSVAFFDMAAAPRLCQEAELWAQVERDLDGHALDAGLPKAFPEFLVAGRAWGRYCDGDGACMVGIRVADRLKVLRVSGERHWQGSAASDAAAFESLPLDWAHTYGGPELAVNPAGMGMPARDHGVGSSRQLLPQIEYPDQRIYSPHQAGVPAGLMPLPASHPLRTESYGSPDRRWLEINYPGYPKDMDHGYFNVAPLDQRWPDRVNALDGASYELSQLHPSRPQVQGVLPSVRALALLGRRGMTAPETLELRLSTVWFFPADLRVAMIYHGCASLECFDTADVDYLLLAAELTNQQRDAAYYQNICGERLQPGHTPAQWPVDDELVPASLLRQVSDAGRPVRRGELRQRYQQAAGKAEVDKATQAIAQHQLQSAKTWPELKPELEHSAVVDPAGRKAMQLDGAALKQRADQQKQAADEAQARLLAETAKHGQTSARVEAALQRPLCGPPTLDAASHLLASAPASLPSAALQQQIEQANQGLRQAYQQSAHFQSAAPQLSTADSANRRQQLEQAHREGRSLAGWDLTGLNLAGIDLQGADLSAALMESVDFSGARLDGCNLTRSVLVRSRLSRVSMRSARLLGANLAGSTIEDSDLGEARWEHTVLDDASLVRCRMTGSHLQQCRLRNTRLDTIDLQRATLSEMVLDRLELRNVNCQGSRLRKLAFVQCQLHELDFSDTDIQGLAMVACQLDHLTRFARSRIVKACFVNGCEFDRPDFSSAQLRENNWRGAKLAGLSLVHARISASDFTDASLVGGNLSGAKFEQVQLVRTDLTDANLESADLLGAYMRGACLDGACLQRANLFRANLGEVRMDQHTRFDQAYLKRYSVYPLGRPQTAES